MISLTDLMKVSRLSGLKVIAGENGVGRKINTVTLLDAPDGPKWLKGGEFVLTSAYIFNNSYELLEEYIQSLIEHNASGLGIKTGRFLNGVPDNIVRIADENCFPIVQIPYDLVWTDVISPFYKLKYSRYDSAKPFVIDPAMILPLFKAGKWGGKQLLLQLTELVHRPIGVYRPDKSLILNNGIRGVQQIEEAVSGMTILPERWNPQRVTVNGFICIVFCLPLSYDKEWEYLAFASEQEADINAIVKLMDLLESLNGKTGLPLREKTDAYRVFLYKIISFTITPEEIVVFEENRSAKKKGLIYTGIMILSSEAPMQSYQNLKDSLMGCLMGKGLKIESYAFEYKEQQQAVIIWEVYMEDTLNSCVWIRGLIPLLDRVFAAEEKGAVAISSMSDSLKNIVQLYEQTRTALHLGELLWPHQRCHFYPDYSAYVLLNESDLNQIDFGDCILLCENKSTMAFQPIMTAEVYIESGNYKKAANKQQAVCPREYAASPH